MSSGSKVFYEAQGDTIDTLVVDFACRRSKAGVYYIGLPRVRNLSNLYIRNLDDSKIKMSEKVVNEMDRLRRQPLKICLDFFYSLPCTTFKILCHNLKLLHLHINDIRSDFNVKATDIAVLSKLHQLHKTL